jgi:hypothetical protein
VRKVAFLEKRAKEKDMEYVTNPLILIVIPFMIIVVIVVVCILADRYYLAENMVENYTTTSTIDYTTRMTRIKSYFIDYSPPKKPPKPFYFGRLEGITYSGEGEECPEYLSDRDYKIWLKQKNLNDLSDTRYANKISNLRDLWLLNSTKIKYEEKEPTKK